MSTPRPSETQPRRPRADAERNRARLLDAARAAFASGREPVSLEQIARDSGVGIGTLYRHFPTREALVEALYRKELADLCASVDDLLDDARRRTGRCGRGWTGSPTTSRPSGRWRTRSGRSSRRAR